MIDYLKKVLILIGAAIAITLAQPSNLYAQQGNNYLYWIMVYTNGILQQVNNLPNYLSGLGQYIISWMTQDNSSSTTTMQQTFATIGSQLANDVTLELAQQPQLTAALFSPPPPAPALTTANLSAPSNVQSSILNLLPNINELTYSSLLGQPPSPKAPNVSGAPFSYIKNASGLTLLHTMPNPGWRGTQVDQYRYSSVYNTIMSIASYNAYVLSNQMVEAQQGLPLSNAQISLINQASSSGWSAQVATEELGKVLRQLLLFQSQSYVLISDMIRTQKQLLNAQVMTNALLILQNQNNETLLVAKAQGVKPQ